MMVIAIWWWLSHTYRRISCGYRSSWKTTSGIGSQVLPNAVAPGQISARSAGNLLAGSSENNDACRVARSAEASISIAPNFPAADATR